MITHVVLILFIKNVLIKIKNSIFPPKYTKYGTMLASKIVDFEEIYKVSPDYFFIRIISFFLFIKNVFKGFQNPIFPTKYT